MNAYQRYAVVVAAFATALYLALVVAAFGMLSLITDLEVISDRDAGAFVGPTMVGITVIGVALSMVMLGIRRPPAQQRIYIGLPILVGLGAYFVYLIVGAILAVVGEGDPFAFVLFLGGHLGDPFAISIGVLAIPVVIAYEATLVARGHGGSRPHWPWERDED
ncbi:DUF6121 family protein [Rathayibacter sp. YIM 133350]|uniref:DUF6121 family protein n=1 Tax=Rathayibacter sp. YIM 133350 TaxID=3131992 RepID=UPI00307DE25A